jgi:hypothetical protein
MGVVHRRGGVDRDHGGREGCRQIFQFFRAGITTVSRGEFYEFIVELLVHPHAGGA